MNEIEIDNLKILSSKLNEVCLNVEDYIYLEERLKNIVCYSPFSSDMMIEVIKKGCLGRFYHQGSDKVWAGHCWIRKSVRQGHFKILYSDPNQAIWGYRKWSSNFNLASSEDIKMAINRANKINNLKAFW
jgi:hypothetical protein